MRPLNLTTPAIPTSVYPFQGANNRRSYRRTGKRAFDLAFALVIAPVVVPVFVVLWFANRLFGGTGLFVQERIGADGQIFRCLKFETMIADAEKVLQDMCDHDPRVAWEWQANQKLLNDPRVTKFGGVLREASLDELPQFFNVLRGDMSFVGPRPFLPSQQDLYDRAGGVSYYSVRPGITGPWQVNGRGVTAFQDRVLFDERYVKTMSCWNDLWLLLKTVRVVLKRTGH